jgi:hypothetical protein
MMKVNIKGFGELEFPDGTSPEQMKASINSAIASGKLKPKVEESVEPQKEYTPPELEYNLDNPQELAQAISQKEGISYEEAYERVAGQPRSARASYEGASFPIASNVADVVTLPFRSLAGLSSVFSGEDPLDRMANPVSEDENPYTGFLGNMANDAFSYTPTGVAKLGGTALANSSKLMQGVKEGVVAGLGEYGLDEYQKEEQGIETGNNLGTGLLQSAIGGVAGGAFGKYADKKASKKELEEMPTVLRNEENVSDDIAIDYSGQGKDEVLDDVANMNVASPEKHRDRILLDVQKGTGFSKSQAESLPTYARKEFANIDDEGKRALNNYMMQAQTASSNLQAPTPYDLVGQMFVRGKDAIQQARQQAGSTMGDIERQYLSGSNPDGSLLNGAISTAKMKENWAKLLEDHGGLVRENGELVSSTKRAPVIGAFYQEFADADQMINGLGDFVTGDYLRSVEKNLSQLTKVAGAGRNGVMNSEADMAVNKMIKESRDLVGEQIKQNGGEEALSAYNQAKKDYGKYWTAEDFIDRRLGKNIADGEDSEFATRGASMVQGMMRNEDRNSKALARMIQNLTGENIGKHAVFAKFAMQSAQDKRGGGGWTPNWSKSGLLDKIGTWGYNKLNPNKRIPKDFEGMASMVSGATPTSQQTPSILEQAGENPYIASVGKTFGSFLQPKVVRSGGRGMFSGEQESNKVTENPLGAIGQNMVNEGKGN